ncbi:MAG: DUF3553 domain-containing protein, partial [Nitrospirae bacterium]|nr:DUF3553 domain-containing protein [Nitrospirota bacterium]
RRLCYVGMTRAKQRLYLIHTEMRRLYGSVQWNAPSRFLDEVPAELFESVFEGVAVSGAVAGDQSVGHSDHDWTAPTMEPAHVDAPDVPAEIDGVAALRAGARVRHPLWGMGTVKLSEGRGERQKVVVHFASVGIKKLLVQQARLEQA